MRYPAPHNQRHRRRGREPGQQPGSAQAPLSPLGTKTRKDCGACLLQIQRRSLTPDCHSTPNQGPFRLATGTARQMRRLFIGPLRLAQGDGRHPFQHFLAGGHAIISLSRFTAW